MRSAFYTAAVLGLRALGHDVYYVEDCGEESWVYNWQTEEVAETPKSIFELE